MLLRALVVVALAAAAAIGAVAGREPAAPASAGDTSQVVPLGDREYRLALPAAAPGAAAAAREGAGAEVARASAPLPLVLVAHGRTRTALDMVAATGFGEHAVSGEAVVVFLQGSVVGGTTSWDAGTCCAPAADGVVDDLGYVEAVVADATARAAAAGIAVDPDRTWWVGYSNGGMLGYRAACTRPGLVDALVVVAASRTAWCGSPQPVPVLHVHGSDDEKVPLEGTPWSDQLRTPLRSAEESLRPFRDAGAPVELVVQQGVGHQWAAGTSARAWGWLAALA